MKRIRWTDWLAAAAVVLALGALAGADDFDPTTSLLKGSHTEA